MVKGFKVVLFSHKDFELDKWLEESSLMEVDWKQMKWTAITIVRQE